MKKTLKVVDKVNFWCYNRRDEKNCPDLYNNVHFNRYFTQYRVSV